MRYYVAKLESGLGVINSINFNLFDDCIKKFLYNFILMGREPENKNG